MVVGGREWWVANIICQSYDRMLGGISHSSNPCSIAMLVDCYFIFLVGGVLYEKYILRRVLNLEICIQLCFLNPFLMDWVYCSQKNGMFSVLCCTWEHWCLGIFLTRFSAHFVMMFKIQNLKLLQYISDWFSAVKFSREVNASCWWSLSLSSNPCSGAPARGSGTEAGAYDRNQRETVWHGSSVSKNSVSSYS